MLKFGFADHLSESLCLCLCGWRPTWLVQRFCRRCGRPFLDPWDVVGLRTTASVRNVLEKYGPHGELFIFLILKETFVRTEAVEFRHGVTAETKKACALIGLHRIAEEATSTSFSGLPMELRGLWRVWWSKEPFWER